MLNTEQTIEIDAPLSVVYNQYTQFEEFPRFMEGVKSVKQIDDTHLHWVAEVDGKTAEWDAEITDQQPDKIIAWRSISGAHNAGTVLFEALDPQRTKITAKLEAEAEGLIENIGGVLGSLDRRVKGDLERFRDYLEQRGSESGGWRGTVDDGQVVDSSSGVGEPLSSRGGIDGDAVSSDEIDPALNKGA